MVPSRPDIDAEAARREIEANQDRIEAAFLKYIHRADPYDDHEMVEHSHEEEFDDNPHEFEIIVGHGNVIRYFFCRALQLPPEVWLRFSTFNCSISKWSMGACFVLQNCSFVISNAVSLLVVFSSTISSANFPSVSFHLFARDNC